ncbi:hypothetical protein DCAR_0103478 [Daucus carota subsp. sativus]|uniref:Uncharacterized protein n=1 Tax=Daucus carota subsp. sativus TaxID=79200 RepID=A0AAF0WA79_DAUCS|nr:hypothetical protein DCAR_0103478 [Daucus carota subsp. sativus]
MHHCIQHHIITTPDILSSTRKFHGYSTHQIFPHSSCFPSSHPLHHPNLFGPSLRQIMRRIGLGLFVATFSMVAAAIMEKRRRVAAVESNEIISIFWITPQYLIFGLSEMFTAIGLIEFFYKQNIKGMQSFLTAMTYCSYSFGFYLSSVLVSLVNKITSNSSSRGWMGENDLNHDRLDLFYWFLAVLSLINFVNYLFWAKWYNRSIPLVLDAKPQFDSKSVKANYVGDDLA